MTRRWAIAVALLPTALLIVWITGVGGWLGLWHDTVQWSREVTGASPGLCIAPASTSDGLLGP